MGWVILPLLTVFAHFFYLLPRQLQVRIGMALGYFLNKAKLKAKVVDKNLSLAFGSDDSKKERIRKESYYSLGNLILEILLLFGPFRRFIVKYVDFVGAENYRKAIGAGKGVIFLSSHVGNWEIMAAGGVVHVGMDLMLVTKHLKPEWLHRAIEKRRAKCGVKATYEPKTAREVLLQIKRNGAVGFVLDQYAGAPIGVRVPLFGTPVGTSLALAAFAKRTGATILPVHNYRKPNGRFTIEILPPFEWQTEFKMGDRSGSDSASIKGIELSHSHYELAANTARFASILEKDIINHPEQWLWVHNRFKGDLSPLRAGEWEGARVRS